MGPLRPGRHLRRRGAHPALHGGHRVPHHPLHARPARRSQHAGPGDHGVPLCLGLRRALPRAGHLPAPERGRAAGGGGPLHEGHRRLVPARVHRGGAVPRGGVPLPAIHRRAHDLGRHQRGHRRRRLPGDGGADRQPGARQTDQPHGAPGAASLQFLLAPGREAHEGRPGRTAARELRHPAFLDARRLRRRRGRQPHVRRRAPLRRRSGPRDPGQGRGFDP